MSVPETSMPDLLSAAQERIRTELRAALLDLDRAIAAIGASDSDRTLISDALRGLDELFLLVVVGEFNAGKSALLNELLGTRILAEGVTPTTAAITLVRHGERESEEWHGESLLVRTLSSPALRDLSIVDTPGTNAILRHHEQLTRDFVPRADLILFVTSADRPFTETERDLLERIRGWGKKIVVVVNKIDLIESPAGVEQILTFVRQGLQTTLGFNPPIFAVSVRLARVADNTADEAAARAIAAASHVDDLRHYVFETLDEEARLRLKFATPLGVAEQILERYQARLDEHAANLDDDIRLVENVDRQIEISADDLRRDSAPRLIEIENIIHELNDRGERFFEETVRIGRVFDLLNPERTRGAFEREVLTDTSERIDAVVSQTVDWFVEAEARLWRQVQHTIRERQQVAMELHEHPDFLAARREVLQSVAERTRAALRGFDRELEAREVGQAMRDAVAQTAIAEIGAVSLGAAIAILFGTVAADITGLLAATLLASLGLYILPARKRRALAEFRKKTDELRERLVTALRAQLDREITGSAERVREAIAPYTRYVRAEAQRLEEHQRAIRSVAQEFGRLKSELGGSEAEPIES